MTEEEIPAQVWDLLFLKKGGYVYQHSNDSYIWKPAIVVEADSMYFDSPLVLAVWCIRNGKVVKII